jgi:integrase
VSARRCAAAPLDPDTITSRFRRIVESAGPPKINLHDVRHSYASAGRDAKIDWKALSERIGHSDVAFTMRQYVQTDLEVHRQVATALAKLILGDVVPVAEFPAVRGNGPDAAT